MEHPAVSERRPRHRPCAGPSAGSGTLTPVRSNLARRLLPAAATLLLFTGTGTTSVAGTQTTQPTTGPGASTFGDTIDVRVVNVDVRVTDRDGNPVTGLKPGDFEVREDGRPVELSNFFEFTDGLDDTTRQQPARGSRRSREDPPEDLGRFIRAEPPPPEHRLSLMVYVDNHSLTPVDRNRLLPFLRNFLRVQLTPWDQVMLAVFDKGRYEVVLPFTAEAWRIAEATNELERVVGGRERTNSERVDILREINRDDASYVEVIGLVRNFAVTTRSEVSASLVNLGRAVQAMAGLPGRKAVLYVSNGLPMRPAEDLFRAIEERFSDPRGRWRNGSSPFTTSTGGFDAANASLEAYEHDLSRQFDEIAALANANRVTFHGVAAASARLGGMNTADLRFSTSIEFTRAANLEEPLLRLADRTGGRAIVNTRNFAGGFDSIASDLQNGYSLGYSPEHLDRGRTHRIEVELTDEARRRHGRRLTIRHRDSYIDKPTSTEMADLTLAALSFGQTANPMGARIAPVRGPGNSVRLDSGDILTRLLVAVPIRSLTLVPADGEHRASYGLWVQVGDEAGRTSEVTEHTVSVVVAAGEEEDARQRSWPFVLDVVTGRGPHRVAVGVRDDLSAATSVATIDLDAGNEATVLAATAAGPPSGSSGDAGIAGAGPDVAKATGVRENVARRGVVAAAGGAERGAAGSAAATNASEPADRALAEATAHYQRGELDLMARAARTALGLTDDIRLRTRAWNALGVALFDKPDRNDDDVREAENAFRRVVAIMDDQASLAPRYSLARLLADSGRPTEGVAAAREILQIATEGPIPDRARVLVCQERETASAAADLGDPNRAAANAGGDGGAEGHAGARAPGPMIYRIAHEYTEEARSAATEGTVTLRASIDAEGCVVGVDVLEALPDGLTESAEAAMSRAVFRPATADGEPVASSQVTALRFSLDDD